MFTVIVAAAVLAVSGWSVTVEGVVKFLAVQFSIKNPTDVAGVSRFGDNDIASIVHRDNVFGTQYHPEKSQDAGLDLLHAVLNALK